MINGERITQTWDKDWSAGVGGHMYGTPKMDDGFKEVMSKVQKAHPRSNLSDSPKLWQEQEKEPTLLKLFLTVCLRSI